MPPNVNDHDSTLLDTKKEELPKLIAPQADDWKFKISYPTVVVFIYFHLSAIYGLYLCFTSAHWATMIHGLIFLEAGLIGILAGAHRYWSHRSFKAKLPLQIILIIFQSIGGQYTAYNWAKDHRNHHKHADTDADPHNSTRGLFFSHIGWLLVQKHPEYKRRAARIDISDLKNDKLLTFQYKHGFAFIFTLAYFIPTLLPMLLWGETFVNAFHVNILRTILSQNYTSLVNSFAHAYGKRPYDKNVRATDNMLCHTLTTGEGFHNYHHVFPWDYRSAELGTKFNTPAAFIDFFAWIGWAYDLKTAEYSVVAKRALRCGDGTFKERELKNENDF
ncbi:acyl-CoA Delta(11) desaturase-like [Leguminivora glycinivorella]|uniref:acyl-CoA Delta(11) desaturase-like n=1 Tax=Leguminivora glycinivorella TaxID=1035111 RepID=UPI00200C8BFA|nr:acyl-CoA Delta(11) desaturase-like [Leguminivora glycinivorella]XP_047989478.1 acyl-CoA Delta(11) desaturase-like [Leguminivora glycinivorella]